MELGFDLEHKLLRQMLENFSENEVKPLAAEVDETERFPEETVKKMKDIGILGIPFPSQYGGEDGDYIGYVLAVEELSKVCATTGVVLSAHTSLCCGPIYEFGTEEQKQKYLVPLAKGDKLGAFALTEPNAGTDASKQQTIAKEDGDDYIINGSKIFITNAGHADIFIVMAMTDPSLGTKGITAFIMEKDMQGFTIGKKEKKMGIRGSSTCELIFDDVRVPKENILGRVGYGFKIAMKTLDSGRIGIAAQACGIAEGALNETIAYVKERKQFNRPIAKFQNTQFVLADLATKIDAARMLVYRAAYNKDQGLAYNKEAAMAKLFAAEVAVEVTNKAVQLHGGYGYSREYPVERMMRDAKITEIYEGTSEVQKMVVASHILG
jgi:butyryl-CoA dehydrogenase